MSANTLRADSLRMIDDRELTPQVTAWQNPAAAIRASLEQPTMFGPDHRRELAEDRLTRSIRSYRIGVHAAGPRLGMR